MYLMRCHLCTERTTRDQEQCPGGHPTNWSPVRFYSIYTNSLLSEAYKRIYPFQCLATNSIAKQFTFKDLMRGCIKCLFKIQYECVNLSSTVQDFSPIIYYHIQLSFTTVLCWMCAAYLTGVYIHQDEPWYLNILSDLELITCTCKCIWIQIQILSISWLLITNMNTFFMNVIEYKYKYFANVFKYILITLSWNENRKAVSVSFVAALMHCWGMGIFIQIGFQWFPRIDTYPFLGSFFFFFQYLIC